MKKYLLLLPFSLAVLIFSYLLSRPDGLLHIIFCNVGQGDATYMRLPDGSDVLIDGGPDGRVLSCLGSHMAFGDRTIELVAMTHPQKDHYGGLKNVAERYTIKHFITVNVGNNTPDFLDLLRAFVRQGVDVRYVTAGTTISIGESQFSVLWPRADWLHGEVDRAPEVISMSNGTEIPLTKLDLNLFSLYLQLEYKYFDLLLTGDGDIGVQKLWYEYHFPLPRSIEILKAPHHGSKTALLPEFVSTIAPQSSIISVGKNKYGHPSRETVSLLAQYGKVYQTVRDGEVEIVTDGNYWWKK